MTRLFPAMYRSWEVASQTEGTNSRYRGLQATGHSASTGQRGHHDCSTGSLGDKRHMAKEGQSAGTRYNNRS